MAMYKPRVISLAKKPGQNFGFYLRVEQNEEGHLIRCLEMGGPAELAGMKDGDRVLWVNRTFVDGLSHSEVVELVRNSGTSVAFHVLDETSYKQAKTEGVNLSNPQSKPVANGVAKAAPKPKLCYLVKSNSNYDFSLRSVKGEMGLFMTDVTSGGVACKAGVRNKDRLLEINGENVENCTHDEVVEKIRKLGGSVMFLLADDETDKFYQSKHAKIGAWLATVKHLPHKPRIINMSKGSDGYGFMLKEEPNHTGHLIGDIERGSPAEKAGLKEMDRVVAVDGNLLDSCSHDQVVDRIKKSGDQCCLLVVDQKTDQIYQQGKVSPMLFWEDMKDSNSPPSYIEAMNTSASVRPSTLAQKREENPRPKLCKMEKTAHGFGFHLNGIQGLFGQYIKEVVKGGAADIAGLEDEDIVIEVNGVNVEQSSHEEVVGMIRRSGNHLEMLVCSKNLYEELKIKGETFNDHVHTADTPETIKKRQEEARPETPTKAERQRTPSVSSSSSAESLDMRL
ncbi:Na(+)/H(+) exchange regulatory cofactor NHE-RF3 [Odontesthes bonariensis]|uniref:Na(+)/H(+) exchange regulatory cofactor NHE-RF3 n=1 Tax=Odontesthes bonariensis TaxID=219752 RepID=UPI003F580EC6